MVCLHGHAFLVDSDAYVNHTIVLFLAITRGARIGVRWWEYLPVSAKLLFLYL